jgi:hypothetical protein
VKYDRDPNAIFNEDVSVNGEYFSSRKYKCEGLKMYVKKTAVYNQSSTCKQLASKMGSNLI